MMPRRFVPIAVAALLVALAGSYALTVVVNGLSSQPYPPMSAGNVTGSISGRIVNGAGVGVNNSYVAVVNAGNTDVQYAFTYSDSGGYYHFSSVNSTGGGNAYRIYGQSGTSKAVSDAFAVNPGNGAAIRDLALVTPTPTPVPSSADIYGYLTEQSTGGPLVDAYVTVVNATDAYHVYQTTRSNRFGYYRFYGVNVTGAPGYRIHVGKDGYDEIYSPPFVVNSSDTRQFNFTVSRTRTPTPIPAASPTATGPADNSTRNQSTPTPSGKPWWSGIPGTPGFEIAAALGGVAIACALRRKG